MAGEYKLAQQLFDQGMQQAEQDPSMGPEALANALLGLILTDQAKNRSKADIQSFVEHHLENIGDDEMVITRGC